LRQLLARTGARDRIQAVILAHGLGLARPNSGWAERSARAPAPVLASVVAVVYVVPVSVTFTEKSLSTV
jgi:hypothetical protein